MEKAISVKNEDDLLEQNSSYTRIYFGTEFCQNLMPKLDHLKKILALANKKQLNFTFVSPYINDQGIKKTFEILKFLHGDNPEHEIVFNDWGIFNLLKEDFNFRNIILGRLCSRQVRDPRIYHSLKKRVSASIYNYFQKARIDVPGWWDFLNQNGISRIELDNLLQGITRNASPIHASLHYPFCYAATTRYCPYPKKRTKDKDFRKVIPCGRECINHSYKLFNPEMPGDVFLNGNTYFIKNDNMPKDLTKLNIDRTIFHKTLPI